MARQLLHKIEEDRFQLDVRPFNAILESLTWTQEPAAWKEGLAVLLELEQRHLRWPTRRRSRSSRAAQGDTKQDNASD